MTGPVWVTTTPAGDGPVELRVPARVGAPYARARVLVRDGSSPVRFVDRALEGDLLVLDADEVAPAAGTSSRPERLAGLISVVVCTRDRAEQLRACLHALLALEDGDVEVLVVDNSSTGSAAAMFDEVAGADPRFRLVHEPKPGLSRARNRGLAEARGEVVAYTDDDVRVDPAWLDGVRAGFGSDRGVGCVTGLVAAAELEDPVQELFESKVSWSSSLERRRYSMRTDAGTGAFPYDAGRFGTGANFAVRRSLLLDLGGFDEALGAGSPTRGGEDLDAFVRVLLAGADVVYEPRAIVWHVHRSSAEELGRQVYAYGLGLSAYVTKLLLGPARRDVVRRMLRGAGVFVGDKRAERSAGLPPSLLARELLGCAVGPFAYLRARRAVPRC